MKMTTPRSTPRGGDILESHKHAFTEDNVQFQPRILISNQKSRLSQQKYYNPPTRKSQASLNNTASLKKTGELISISYHDYVVRIAQLLISRFNL